MYNVSTVHGSLGLHGEELAMRVLFGPSELILPNDPDLIATARLFRLNVRGCGGGRGQVLGNLKRQGHTEGNRATEARGGPC